VSNGYRHVINTGPDGRQEVQHLHMHVMGDRAPGPKVKTQRRRGSPPGLTRIVALNSCRRTPWDRSAFGIG